MRPETLNYYEILEVSPTASQDSIYQAYQSAQYTFSLKNPDIYKVFSPEEAKAWFDLIEEAYAVIGFPNTRRAYDFEVQQAKVMPSLELDETTKDVEDLADTAAQEGFATTRVSQYKVNPKMEEQIEKQEVFDGIFLKKVREYKNIDLTDFSKHTCIAIRHLYAIENNNFAVLPAVVFVRGYIIQYCRTLGLDEKRVVSSFMSLIKDV